MMSGELRRCRGGVSIRVGKRWVVGGVLLGRWKGGNLGPGCLLGASRRCPDAGRRRLKARVEMFLVAVVARIVRSRRLGASRWVQGAGHHL